MRLLPAIVPALMLLMVATAVAEDRHQIEFFESRIRPVLVQHCFECHSAEAESPRGGLSLDLGNGMVTGGDSGPVVVAGEPEASLLIEALRYETLQMPPSGRLPQAVIDDFEKWVRDGAVVPRTDEPLVPTAPSEVDLEKGRQFWSFQPPQGHAVPAAQDRQWAKTWIDRFLLARLEEAGLQPASDVDRYRLLRRLSFDLTGLPPTPEQIEAFVQDDSSHALERVVDRLLSSRQFGEHWGRHWLDVARYADSNGSDFNATFHDAWRYRNYVIDSFNADKPFDQFIREQIAGDLLPYQSDEQRAEQLIATGFLMLGPKMLSERDKEKLDLDVVDEQVDTVGRAFLGMTLGCARCHDHKFDPVPTEDYYALAGIFGSTLALKGESQQYVSTWQPQPLPLTAEHKVALEQHEQQTAELAERIKQAEQAQEVAQVAAANALSQQVGTLVDHVDAHTVGSWNSSTYSPWFVGEGYLHDDDQGKGEKSVTFVPDLPEAGEYEVRLSYAAGGNRASNVPIRIVHADGVAELTLDQQPTPPIANLFKAVGQFHFEAGKNGSVTISTEGTEGYVMADAAHFVPVEALEVSEERLATAQQAVADTVAALETLEAKREQLDADAPPPPPHAFAVRDRDQINDVHVRIRGEPHNHGQLVPRGFLQVVQGPPQQPSIGAEESGRRELAQWIADPQNPLTARVIVNRIWAHLMGEGLVRSVDNFGQLGEPPTHPELLDQLAIEFVEQGWSVKALVRQIVLSRAYRMDSTYDDRAWHQDPDNRLLWRAARRRLTAESIRDGMLAISGQLDLSPGGSPVEGLGTLVTTNDANTSGYEQGESATRTIYMGVIRNELPEMLTSFDFADPDFVTGRRPVTTVPSQALLLMNSPMVRDCAVRTADRLMEEVSSKRKRVQRAYLTILGRPATPEEQQHALEFLGNSGQPPADGSEREVDERELWSRLVHALLACTEFRMVD